MKNSKKYTEDKIKFRQCMSSKSFTKDFVSILATFSIKVS
jgi:hypothetical protein